VLTTEEALILVKKNITIRNSLYHMIAVKAIMEWVARHLGENDKLWGLTGLLHDIDYEKTEGSPEKHALYSEEILKDFDVPEGIVRAIKAHNFLYSRVEPQSIMEKALIACDAVSGLLVACALVMPSKKLAEVKVKSVVKKFKDKSFARGVERDRILFCEELGVSRKMFFKIALDGLKSVSSEICL
jgi:putative nucleotidyltransferase with HDIG domain